MVLSDVSAERNLKFTFKNSVITYYELYFNTPVCFIYILISGGRIDHGHHAGVAYNALLDTLAFEEAVEKALEMVDLDDTLVIVTADHGHVMTMAGYPSRGNPILGKKRSAFIW